MKSKVIILFLLLSQLFSCDKRPQIKTGQYSQDFNYFWTTINDEYCYFNKKQTNWQKVKEIYAPVIDTITNRDQFVTVLEKALYEIYDHHAILNTNNDNSPRLVPAGADI